ncbi:hypothetical protein SRCM101294_01707 [Bacillus amyloliquefaciens]|nr:hypothetical protein SRCM101294_01707 [Bacillus amyloliquefaciens]
MKEEDEEEGEALTQSTPRGEMLGAVDRQEVLVETEVYHVHQFQKRILNHEKRLIIELLYKRCCLGVTNLILNNFIKIGFGLNIIRLHG